MPAITFYRHGLTASFPNMGNPNPPKRGRVTGWSAAAARRNVVFLRSVDERTLSGHGYAITLTVRDCPPSSKAWSDAVVAWCRRQERAGLIRLHWVMEFQRRGVPHLHAAAWYAEPQDLKPVLDWLQVAEAFGVGDKGQHMRPIEGVVGWFQYMAKHCSRSKKHYQRQRDSLPAEWASTGRVWGHRGQWTLVEPEAARVAPETFYRLRRLARQMRIAEARQALPLNSRQVGYLRRILKCSDMKRSAVRPVSEWVTVEQQRQLLEAASRR